MRTQLTALTVLALACAANAQIVNGDFQAGNTGFTSGFTFTNSGGSPGLYDEGTYSIVSFDTLHSSWGDFFDHTTGNSDGLFLIANGATVNTSAGPAWSQTVAVLPNTQYELSAWFASLFSGSPSAVEFRLDGNLLVPSIQLGSTVGAWEQHAVTFTTGPATTSINLAIWDTSGIQNGNDYAIDDIALGVVPTPGAAALIGLGGLTLGRRRRG